MIDEGLVLLIAWAQLLGLLSLPAYFLLRHGPLLEEVRNAFRFDGLIVVPRHTGRPFGYERGPGGRAPWLVSMAIRRLHRHSRFATWSQIAALDDDPIRLSIPAGDLSPLSDLYEPDPD